VATAVHARPAAAASATNESRRMFRSMFNTPDRC
jgi:hypothetical protein